MAEVRGRDRRPSGRLVMVATGAALVGTVVFFALMRSPEAVMSGRGYGIVPFELAFTVERVDTILQAWGEEGREGARRSLLIDFGFIPSYCLLFSTVAVVAVRRLAPPGRPRWVLPLLPWAAGVCDVAENLLLLRMLGPSGPAASVAAAAGVFAAVKFALLVLTLAGCVATAAAAVVRRRGSA